MVVDPPPMHLSYNMFLYLYSSIYIFICLACNNYVTKVLSFEYYRLGLKCICLLELFSLASVIACLLYLEEYYTDTFIIYYTIHILYLLACHYSKTFLPFLYYIIFLLQLFITLTLRNNTVVSNHHKQVYFKHYMYRCMYGVQRLCVIIICDEHCTSEYLWLNSIYITSNYCLELLICRDE